MTPSLAHALPATLPTPTTLTAPLPAISVVGLGYVGAVSTACLADLGHRIVGVDIDPSKTAAISEGRSPIHEAGLDELLSLGVESGLIETTSDLVAAVRNTDMTFVSVGTPTAEDGGCDYTAVKAAARGIGEGLKDKDDFHIVVMRCSVPPGTTLQLMVPEIELISGKTIGQDFGVVFNPEFLREATAIADFHAPPKTVIGASDLRSARVIADLYSPVDEDPIITTIGVAEMVKYADNVWHATKVSFANEIGRVCKPLHIDSHKVMEIFVQDTKLNLSPYYLKPGFAFGGSCLPKEVRAVQHLSKNLGVKTPLIDSLTETNDIQIEEAIHMVRETGARRVGVLGLSFKPGTDDLRESPILEVINRLMNEGVMVEAYDPSIKPDMALEGQFDYVRHASPHLRRIAKLLPKMLCESGEDVVEENDVVLVTHATDEFRALVNKRPEKTTVIDLARVVTDPAAAQNYAGIGW